MKVVIGIAVLRSGVQVQHLHAVMLDECVDAASLLDQREALRRRAM
jgi:hypothetical protein